MSTVINNNIIYIVCKHTVPNGPPQNVHHIQLNDTLIGLIWEPPSIELQNGLIVGYNVTVSTSASNETTWKYNSTNTSLTFSLLTGSGGQTTYIFKIAARTKIGVGPYSTYEYITALTSHGMQRLLISNKSIMAECPFQNVSTYYSLVNEYIDRQASFIVMPIHVSRHRIVAT